MLSDTNSLIVNSAEELKTRSDLQLWLVGLNDGANNRDVDVFGADVVRRRDRRNVNVYKYVGSWTTLD